MESANQTKIDFDGQSFSVDAALIAQSFDIDLTQVQSLMRDGRITSRCERGVDEDAGLHRLTFFHDNRRLRLVVSDAGEVVERHVENAPQSRARSLRRARR